MIPQIRKILYATDLSKNSAYAFYYAVNLAKCHNAEIVILHTIELIPAYARAYGSRMETAQQDQREVPLEVIRNRLRKFCEKVDETNSISCVSLVTKILVQVGYPVEEILEAADKEGCDLIILGNHGKGFLRQTFLGSVSRSVLDRTRKPVFIIPLPSEKISIWDEM
jgi:nucleotide-binding universal stress UspA family protein